jgi:hypothetical protein
MDMKEHNQYYQAKWGRSLKVISFCCILIICTIFIYSLLFLPLTSKITVGFMPLLISLGASPFVVRGYFFNEHKLFIKRLFWNTEIDLSELLEVYADPAATKGSLKTFGNGGLFSFTGWFWNRRLGHYKAYVTDPRSTVVLKLSKRTIVVTPDNPEMFISEAKSTNS